jgi:hypothetical protein
MEDRTSLMPDHQSASPADAVSADLTVKLMARMPSRSAKRHFGRQLPENGIMGRCRFVFDAAEANYDWLVVYHDIYRHHGGGTGTERLCCPRANTILITTEPSTITVYGNDYLRQYGTVITSQEPWVIKHPRTLYTQPGLIWFYGMPFSDEKNSVAHLKPTEKSKVITLDDLRMASPPAKDKLLSVVCSNRRGKLTLHSRRLRFTNQLKERMPELEVFGHGIRPISDKAEALDAFQYHIAIENHVSPHHLTEKLPDAFLGYTLPFYHGCQNATDYFPPDSFIPIDVGDFEKTVDIIQSTIANNEYRDRLPYIIEARRRVLEKHNLFAILERYIHGQESSRRPQASASRPPSPADETIMNRQRLRIKKPLQGLRGLIEKATVKGRHYLTR